MFFQMIRDNQRYLSRYSTKNVHFILKSAIMCLFLTNVTPSKRVLCFILSNLHFSMVEGIDNILWSKWLLFIYRATTWNYKKVAWYYYPTLNVIFSLLCGVTLRKHYLIKATMVSNIKNFHSVLKQGHVATPLNEW